MNDEERENMKEKERKNIFIHEVTNNLIPLTQAEKFKLYGVWNSNRYLSSSRQH